MNLFRVTRWLTLIAATILLFGCATPGPIGNRWQRVHYGAHFTPQKSELTVDDQTVAQGLCPAGMPTPIAGVDIGATEFVVRKGYALQFSNDLKIPYWVCEHLTSQSVSGTLTGRSTTFHPDPQVKGPHSENADYSNSGYDKGHQAPNADQTVDKTLREETFYLSNVAPQVPENNQRVWKSLEERVRSWAKEYGEVWAITGGLLYDPKEDNASTADGWVKYDVIGKDGVAVPTHFYKIVARREGDSWAAIAFVLENRAYPTPYAWQTYVEPVVWVQERAGFDFLPELDPAAADAIEQSAATVWP